MRNRLDNLANTLAYKHEVKAMEDTLHMLKIQVDASDYVQKDNDKRANEFIGNLKKKADLTLYIKWYALY